MTQNMTYLEQLRNFRTSNRATELKLSQFIPLSDIGGILVVEGEEDSQLYTNAFYSFVVDEQIKVIICNGKGGVLGLRDYYNSKFSNDHKTLFFIDRDHDNFLGIDNTGNKTYITDNYSIEWDVCTEEILFTLIKRHYTLNEQDPVYGTARKKFKIIYKQWLCYTRPFMQAVVATRRNGELLDLGKTRVLDLCWFEDGVLKSTDTSIEDLLTNSGCTNCPEDKELSHCAAEFYDIDDRKYIRGKLVLQLFCEFFKNLKVICENQQKNDGNDLVTSVQIGKNNYFQYILDDWTVPESLREFIIEWIEDHPKSV